MRTGSEQLRDWMMRRFPGSRRPQRDTAAYFGWHESVIAKFLSGEQAPGLMRALRIEELTGIPARAWMSSRLDESDHLVDAKAE